MFILHSLRKMHEILPMMQEQIVFSTDSVRVCVCLCVFGNAYTHR